MNFIFAVIALCVLAVAGVHGFFYLQTGTFDPCKAAVLRIIQKERAAGQELAASVGILFARQFEDAIRSEGVATCYRSALTGKAPDINLDFDGARR